MIKRELYMSRFRPFIGTDLIKVMTGIHRCAKSASANSKSFSFAEFMELYIPSIAEEPVQKCFPKYLLSCGMPYLANIGYADAPSKQYLYDLFNSVQLRDIVKRNKIRDVDLLERIIAYVMANVGNTFSATSLAKFLRNERRTAAPRL